jgi:hypothetical protein
MKTTKRHLKRKTSKNLIKRITRSRKETHKENKKPKKNNKQGNDGNEKIITRYCLNDFDNRLKKELKYKDFKYLNEEIRI